MRARPCTRVKENKAAIKQGPWIVLFTVIFICITIRPSTAIELAYLQHPDLTIRYDPSLKTTANDIYRIYPRVKSELESIFGWEMSYKPTLILIQDKDYVRRVTGNPITVAFAVPTQNLMVIDCSRLHIRPHQLDQILKHEMVHLLLHYHIKSVHLPRWLDEGVAQWASDDIGELLVAPQKSLLEQALLAGNTIPIDDLAYGFPRERKNLLLAYEQSRSIIRFIITEYGEHKIFEILDHLKSGNDIHSTFDDSLSLTTKDLENRWLAHQKTHTGWFTFMAGHLYEFLFFLAAFLTIIGFIRFLIRKRKYADEEDD